MMIPHHTCPPTATSATRKLDIVVIPVLAAITAASPICKVLVTYDIYILLFTKYHICLHQRGNILCHLLRHATPFDHEIQSTKEGVRRGANRM
jgi:hypothetical protein